MNTSQKVNWIINNKDMGRIFTLSNGDMVDLSDISTISKTKGEKYNWFGTIMRFSYSILLKNGEYIYIYSKPVNLKESENSRIHAVILEEKDVLITAWKLEK